MGRAKLKMELIEKENLRIQTLKKRKEGLAKKLHQLTTLCDVSACMIVYDPATDSSSIWPRDSDAQIRHLVEGYKSKSKDLQGGVRSYGLGDFFKERQKQIEGDLLKLRKKNLEAKYPAWDDCLCFMDESQLRGLAASLRVKADIVRSRIHYLKREASNSAAAAAAFAPQPNYYYAPPPPLPALLPNYYYAPQPLPPLPAAQPYTGCSSIDQNLNYYYYCSDQNVDW
ncbi:agamous-like MADS-box protein AGL82 [Salvia miltiorrhiza]|uniref:agamous-like MADS-box protein AGL82 n=1 Tax=Salvia miltiorrhiza TaxID=226208 RepID=UPI0025AC9A31|nr:agamous-like MADS-box protein AGL82 [Salvia miltiorrhiza]